MKILIIGGGNMGLTYARSFLRTHICRKEDLMILEKSSEKAQALAKKDIGTICTQATECLQVADLIIFAVKPQDSDLLFESIKDHVQDQQVFLSIMAGITISSICEKLKVKKVIRAMPNLPAQTGMGMTVFTSSEEVTRIELVMVQNLINTTGKSIYVEDESKIDAATAISGSGPAYVFFFMNALIKAAQEMGFSEAEAELLVAQTFKGAIDIYNKENFTCQEWIAKVASRGGTTEAALHAFLTHKVNDDIVKGAMAALQRAIDLGKA
ncbi:MAG TPA: pyrroline-5-carboxylate reductase [Phaeodactylibacter sp.]|nr:pyrroline-5-carboxylate reductase [Phaeodactylibacter sp.]